MAKKNSILPTLLAAAAILVIAASAYVIFSRSGNLLTPSPDRGTAAEKALPFPERMAKMASALPWKRRATTRKLLRKDLLESLKLGGSFLLANQKPEGNFNYQYDFVNRSFDPGDNQVRQAGALWGVSLLHRYEPDEATAEALLRGMDFFFRHTHRAENGVRVIAYPGERKCSTGTVALVALAIIETLRNPGGIPEARQKEMTEYLDGYIAFLLRQQRSDGRFSKSAGVKSLARSRTTSPYFDGESLLAFVKAARYLGRRELIPAIQKAARRMAEYYTVEAWENDVDSDKTKGAYQWSSMAFEEYSGAGFDGAKLYEDVTLVLGWWMIHTHRTLRRTRNTAYAHEGLAGAFAVAKRRGDEAAVNDLGFTIDRGLYKLTSWQVGGPLSNRNPFLRSNPTSDPLAVGGIMNAKNQAPLRIDVTQHQTHAIILALQNVYTR